MVSFLAGIDIIRFWPKTVDYSKGVLSLRTICVQGLLCDYCLKHAVNLSPPPQGVIYSSTAADNYAANYDLFNLSIPNIPAKRLGYPEEV